MKNAECNVNSLIEQAAIMAQFPRYLSDSEEEIARKYFNHFVFFRKEDKSTRKCVCTSCMEAYYAHKETSPDFFAKHHHDMCECPNCGQRSELLAMGKFKNFNSLSSHMRCVQLSAHDGAVLLQAGWLSRDFDEDDLGGTIDFIPFRRYYFAPGRRAAWNKYASCWFGELSTSAKWIPQKTIKEPFQRDPYETEALYAILGYENIIKTQLRYCQYEVWFDDTYGSYIGGLQDFCEAPFRIAFLIRYLSEYTRRPQMEILAKLDHMSILTDLIIHRKQNGNYLNWKADNPADFFRLSKTDYTEFKKAEFDLDTLRDYRRMRKAELVASLKEFTEAKKRIGDLFKMLCACVLIADVSIHRAENYINSFRADCHQGYTPVSTILTCWKDYLDAARLLKYDLKRDDVRIPRDLSTKHDQATAAARVVTDKKATKKYAKRYKELIKQFEYSEGALSIVIPDSVAHIVEEGKKLKHCVGGYAERHINGKITILFLRRREFPSVPYVTIELTAEQNCEKITIKQIHGYKNDLDKSKTPAVLHKKFLEKWLKWVHGGSKRDNDGNPIILAPAKNKNSKEVQVA